MLLTGLDIREAGKEGASLLGLASPGRRREASSERLWEGLAPQQAFTGEDRVGQKTPKTLTPRSGVTDHRRGG